MTALPQGWKAGELGAGTGAQPRAAEGSTGWNAGRPWAQDPGSPAYEHMALGK